MRKLRSCHILLAWVYTSLATWYVAGSVGGVLILFAERRDRRCEPSDDDVRRAAERDRQYHGAEAFRVIGDHMLEGGLFDVGIIDYRD